MFGVSALVCGLLAFYYPFILVWEKKRTKDAVQIVVYETVILGLFMLFIMGTIILIH
jgi:hypothetical protein